MGNNYRVISFDLYDTLIYRNISNVQIFTMIENEFFKKTGKHIKGFLKKRIKYEKKCRDVKNCEITLNDIYNLFINLTEDEKKILYELECKIEVDTAEPIKETIAILNNYKKRFVKIAIITDIYLPKKTIIEILNKIKVSYDYLFVSSEVGYTKYNKKLYEYALNEMKISNFELFHCGDNVINDYINPRTLGINSDLVVTSANDKSIYSFNCNIDEFILHGFHFNKITPAFRIGYNILGPLMISFCNWIHEEIETKKLDKVYFVAREGYFIKKCFDILYENSGTYYTRINRSVVRFATIKTEDEKVFINSLVDSIPKLERYSINQILYYLGLEKDCELLNTLKNNNILNMSRDGLVSGLYNNEVSLIMEKYKNTYNLKKEFDELLKIDNFNGKIGLVNNSINGTIQNMLENYFKDNKVNCELYGLQFVDSKLCNNRLIERYSSWSKDLNIEKYYVKIFKEYSLIIEHLLFENIGSARYFSNGYLFEDRIKEQYNNFSIEEIQNAALKFIHDYKKNPIIIDPELSFLSLCNMLSNPKKEDALLLSNLFDDEYDNYVVIQDCSINLKGYRNKFKFIRKIHNFYWIEGLLTIKNKKRLLNIYNVLKKIKNR